MVIYSNLYPDNKYRQWLNSLPVAKNIAGQPAGILGASPATGHRLDDTSVKKVLYSGEAVTSDIKNFTGVPLTELEFAPSSLREYTLQDALNYQYNKEFAIKLDDLMSGNDAAIKLRPPGSAVPEAFIEGLRQNGIQQDGFDAGWIQFYLHGLNEDSAQYSHSVDYLASGYVAARENIDASFTGEERAVALARLDKDFGSAISILAQKVSQELGGFFAEGGSGEETQKIYDSVVNAYAEAVEGYSAYIKSNRDYAGLDGSEDAWLKQDSSYMASALRKTASSAKASRSADSGTGYYSLEELEKTQTMVHEIKSHTAGIKHYESEEKIGLDFAILYLKGESFGRYSGVSDSLKNAVSKAIGHYINTAIEQFNQQLRQERKGVAEPGRMADLKKEHVFAVYDRVVHTYKTTGNTLKALQEGAAFGYRQHMEKTQSPLYNTLNRYGENGAYFWRNFYEYTPITLPKSFKPVILAGIPNVGPSTLGGYAAKKTGIEMLADGWNDFISKLTDDEDAKIIPDTFLAYA